MLELYVIMIRLHIGTVNQKVLKSSIIFRGFAAWPRLFPEGILKQSAFTARMLCFHGRKVVN